MPQHVTTHMQMALNVLSAMLALGAALVWWRSARVKPDKPLGLTRADGSVDGLEELAAAVKRQSLLSGKAAMLAAGAALAQAGTLVLGTWRS
jgi:hypothetical protein